MTFTAKQYIPELRAQWAQVLATSKNGLFLFDRDYMEYHANRFVDQSWIAYRDETPIAIFPAASGQDGEVISHPGLTFGGLVFTKTIRTEDATRVIDVLLTSLRDVGFDKLTVKLPPPSFASYPSEEVAYTLWKRGFVLSRRDLSSLLPLNNPLRFNASKNASVVRARKLGLAVGEPTLTEFHELLSDVLRQRHNTTPVHSLADLTLLTHRFPGQMLLRASWLGEQVIAGTLIYRYQHIWHTQYMACSDIGRESGALDLLIDHVIAEAADAGGTHISFGTSNADSGDGLNVGLLWQKESYGARAIVHDSMSGMLR